MRTTLYYTICKINDNYVHFVITTIYFARKINIRVVIIVWAPTTTVVGSCKL